MNYKLCIALILSLNTQAHPLKKTISLLDQIHEAQAYWEMRAQDKKLNFWKRPPHTWIASSGKTEIKYHQKILAQQRSELIGTLAALSENQKQVSSVDVKKLLKQTNRILVKHGAPAHFKRHWVSYAGISAATAVIVISFHQMHHCGINPLKDMYTFFKNEGNSDSKIFTTNIKDNEQLYEDTVTKVLINAVAVDQTAPLMQQSLKGKAIQELTFPEKKRIFLKLTAELGAAIHTEIKHAEEFLQNENQNLTDSKQNISLFTPLQDNGRYPEFYRKSIPEINRALSTINEFTALGKNLGGEAQKYINLINHLTEKDPGFAGLIIHILTTHVLELKLKEASVTYRAHQALHNAKLAIPLMVGTYLGYVGINSLYKYTTASTLITPLKTDLISLQLVLNKGRYIKDCTALPQDFKGECFYWIQRLHRYKESLPASYRTTYRHYLNDLENKTLLPEQKMTLITCLFHELDPLFKRD